MSRIAVPITLSFILTSIYDNHQLTDSLLISKVEICIDRINHMTIATFPRDLFATPELRFLHPRAILMDESNVAEDVDSDRLDSSSRALATARKILRVAKSRHGWSDSKIKDLLCKFQQDSSFNDLDSIAKTLRFAEASYNIAWLAEKSEDFSFWLNLSPHQRDVLFSCASQLRDDISKFGNLNLLDYVGLLKRSFLFNVDFTRFFLDCLDNRKKVVDRTDLMAEIFEKREGKQPRVLNFSKMTQAQRDAAIENYKNIRQDRIDCLTPEQLEESNKQFERAFELLDESRN
jgi:hypothetical protein